MYKEKASAPTEQPIKEGYDLEGWFNKDGDTLWDFAVNEVTKDTELYAKWKAKTDMAYTVQHLQQNISDDKYTVIDTENKTGTTDTMTVAAAKNYPGFTAQAVTQQTIKGDGTTIVQIKYDRNEITLTLDLNDLNISNPHVIKKVKGRYGAPVTVAEPTCHGYKFIGWSPALPATFPETDSSHTAQWKYVYKVNFNVDGSNGTLKAKLDGKPFTGGDINSGKTVVFTAEPDEGYAVEQWTLNGTEVPASAISTTYQCSVTAEAEVRVRFIQKEEAGLIVLSNGLFKRRDNYTTIDPQNPPVAVIAGKLNGNIFGIALHEKPYDLVNLGYDAYYTGLSWAKSNSTGHNTNFEGIVCKPSVMEDVKTATFTGDTDGSDNWTYICSIDPEGTANAKENYPAFYWVNTYNETYKTKLGGKTFAWYMPSIVELCTVWKNREAIDASFTKIHSINPQYAAESLDKRYHWSSSQSAFSYSSAYIVSLDDSGSIFHDLKSDQRRVVCCIAVF